MKIAYVTAGAGGMLCGSCIRDNALARALGRRGHDVVLAPIYTPLRTDEENVAVDRVFYGAVNVYLEQKMPLLRRMPEALHRWLARPGLLRAATASSTTINARALGRAHPVDAATARRAGRRASSTSWRTGSRATCDPT